MNAQAVAFAKWRKKKIALNKGETQQMIKMKKLLSIFLLAVMILGALTGCGDDKTQSFQSMEDFEESKIGVLTGSSFDLLAKEYFPKADRLYYMNISDLVLNLKQEKINGILMDKGFFTPLSWEESAISYVEMDMPATEYAVAFPKNSGSKALMSQINEFIRAEKQSGALAELEAKWLSNAEPDVSIDMSRLTGENGTLRVATTVESKPFDYLKDGQFYGLDAEFIFRFANKYGYALEIDTMDFGALLPSLATKGYDLAISSITVTEERKESVDFSDVYCSSPIVMAVMADGETQKSEQTLNDFSNAKIGIVTGSAHDHTIKEKFPDATRVYFNNMADMILAVQQGKIDCYVEDSPFFAPLIWEGVKLKTVDGSLAQMRNGFVFPQGESVSLREQINEFLAIAKTDGTVDRLLEKWLGNSEPTEHPDYANLEGENGTIRIAISVDNKPMLYQSAEGFTGFEMELLTLFAQKNGYKFEIEVVPFESIIAGISAGKYDMGASSLNITPEREESVDFSDPYNDFGVVLVVNDEENGSRRRLADFENATLGIFSGSSFDALAKERFPNAQRQYYTLVPDMILAVEQGKIDGYITETTYVTAAIWEGAKIEAVSEIIDRTSAGYIFRKDSSSDELREQVNAFIRKSKEDGTLAKLQEKWFGETEPKGKLDYASLTGENGTLRLAVAPDLKPISYIKDGEATGYEMELLVLFAKEYGYSLEMSYVTFDAILPGVTTGKYDIGTGAVTITEERAQSVSFSESHLTVDVVMVVRAEEDSVAKVSFWDKVKESFHKTFIREARWKLIVEGVGVTVLISVCSALAGSLLGFGLYMLSRSDIRLLQKLTKVFAKGYSRIVAGTPIVVILMILFYVVFGSVRDMSGIVVAVIGFTLTFGAFVYDHMTVSVGSVNRGQTEAAYALGYTKNQTFFHIIFPQAMSIFLPSYCGQAVELIKATAVVGYIAVNDLTKMGDIIRSNTYEAFFPLIATAVIYFMLTWILSLLLGLVKLRFEPKRRSEETILKGVKTK